MRSEPACVRLAADEGEVAAQLQEQIPKMDQETAFDLPLLRLAGDGSALAGKKEGLNTLGPISTDKGLW
jgi:hypothetical protein